MNGRATLAQRVFLSEARLATLRQRIAEEAEPAFSAFAVLQQDADAAFGHEPNIPSSKMFRGFITASGRFNVKPPKHPRRFACRASIPFNGTKTLGVSFIRVHIYPRCKEFHDAAD